jgi:ribosomal protein S18 acetylase RimI-like enzyme
MSSTESGVHTYEISTEPARLDVTAIHAYLTRSYWSPAIPIGIVERALRNSLCFGVYALNGGAQVGLARVVTDYATFAYLCDVYVLEEHRGHGLGKRLMRELMSHPALTGARRVMLATRDAHGLYAGFGFQEAGAAKNLMEIVRPDMYAARTDDRSS